MILKTNSISFLLFAIFLLAFSYIALPNSQKEEHFSSLKNNISCLKGEELIDLILPYEIFDKSQEQKKYRKNLNQLVEIGCEKSEYPNITRGNIRIENIQLVFKMKTNEIDKKIEFYENISKYKIINKFANERIAFLTDMKQVYSGIIAINTPIENNPELQGQEFAKAYIALEHLRQ